MIESRERPRFGEGPFTISHVARAYDVHPQTLRLYERSGLLRPARSNGNIRQYGRRDLERLESILRLTREEGINLAGVKEVLRLHSCIETLQQRVRLKGDEEATGLRGREADAQR